MTKGAAQSRKLGQGGGCIRSTLGGEVAAKRKIGGVAEDLTKSRGLGRA